MDHRQKLSRKIGGRSVFTCAIALFATVVASALFTGALAQSPSAVSFENHVQPLFNDNCVFCHMTGAESGGLNLEPGLSYEYLVGVPSEQSDLMRVEPYDPSRSYLFHKLQGTHLDVGGSGAQMPLGGMPFNPEQLAVIRTWIEEGALNQ